MTRTTKEYFTNSEIKEIRERNPDLKDLTNKELMERLAYHSYDLRHNASIILGKIINNSYEIDEMP